VHSTEGFFPRVRRSRLRNGVSGGAGRVKIAGGGRGDDAAVAIFGAGLCDWSADQFLYLSLVQPVALLVIIWPTFSHCFLFFNSSMPPSFKKDGARLNCFKFTEQRIKFPKLSKKNLSAWASYLIITKISFMKGSTKAILLSKINKCCFQKYCLLLFSFELYRVA